MRRHSDADITVEVSIGEYPETLAQVVESFEYDQRSALVCKFDRLFPSARTGLRRYRVARTTGSEGHDASDGRSLAQVFDDVAREMIRANDLRDGRKKYCRLSDRPSSFLHVRLWHF
jgi:hypothetical protein